MNEHIVAMILDRSVDLAHVLLGGYFVRRAFDFLTARFAAVGAEPVVIERRAEPVVIERREQRAGDETV